MLLQRLQDSEKVLTRYGVMNEHVLHHLILIAYKFGMIFFGGVKFCSRFFFLLILCKALGIFLVLTFTPILSSLSLEIQGTGGRVVRKNKKFTIYFVMSVSAELFTCSCLNTKLLALRLCDNFVANIVYNLTSL